MEFKPDNFDKEFSMNKKKKTGSNRGKIPSWLLILAGAAVIGGVVIARQPFIRSADNGTRASFNVQETNDITINAASFSGLNDEQVDSSELEARFISRNNGSDFQHIVPANMTAQGFDMEMAPLEVDENGYVIYPAEEEKNASIYWVEGKPYAVTIQPNGEMAKNAAESAEPSYYRLNGKEYEVTLHPVSESEISSLTSEEMGRLVSANGQTYLLEMKSAGEAASAADEPVQQPATAANTPTAAAAETEKSAEKLSPEAEETSSAVVWLNNKAYSVTVKPFIEEPEEIKKNEPAPAMTETAPAAAQEPEKREQQEPILITNQTEPVTEGTTAEPAAETAEPLKPTATAAVTDTPVETAEPAAETAEPVKPTATAAVTDTPVETAEPAQSEKAAQVSVFTVEGKPYELTLTELDNEEASERSSSQPVIWLDKTPLQVVLQSTERQTETGTESASEPAIEVSLNPLSDEQTSALQQERYGESFIPTVPVPEPTAVPTALPTLPPTAVPEESSWFVNMFTNIFGSTPTQTPTAEIVIILPTATPTVPQPSATPIIVRMVPTATQQGPVRLDVTATAIIEPTAVSTDSTIVKDEASVDAALLDVDDETAEPADSADQVTPGTGDNDGWITPAVAEFSSNGETQVPAVQATPEELPHTGMAEGWNIPSMLALLAGLLLVIIGVRRLRSNR